MTTPRKRPPGRLGKGLSSLMASPVSVSASVPPEPNQGSDRSDEGADAAYVPRGTDGRRVEEIPLAELHPNPLQPRKGFDQEALEGLATSLRSEGMIQPITARPRPAGGYEIVAGERRWRAARLAGLGSVPVLVRPLDDGETARWALIENVQREDLNPIERAEALQRLCDAQGLTHASVGGVVGLSRPMVSNLLRLLALSPAVRLLVADGHLRMGHARALASLGDADAQERVATRCVAEGWSVRKLEQAVRDATREDASPRDPPAAAAPTVRAAWLRDLESQLSEGLETPVQVTPGRKKGTGTVTLEYRTLEDFDRLVERLGVRTG